MEVIDKIYGSIAKESKRLGRKPETEVREIASAKNYVTTPDLADWTYGKNVGAAGQYDSEGGGHAKLQLYGYGFYNVLLLHDSPFKKKVIGAFKRWTDVVGRPNIWLKYGRDQKKNKWFELLVHREVFNKHGAALPEQIEINQELFDEGFRTEIIKEVVGRNSRLIAKAKQHYPATCCICKFDFGRAYGSHGEGFIEMHHLHPISNGKRKSSIKDLRPVCANCHRMLHRGKEMLSIEELKNIFETSQKKRK